MVVREIEVEVKWCLTSGVFFGDRGSSHSVRLACLGTIHRYRGNVIPRQEILEAVDPYHRGSGGAGVCHIDAMVRTHHYTYMREFLVTRLQNADKPAPPGGCTKEDDVAG